MRGGAHSVLARIASNVANVVHGRVVSEAPEGWLPGGVGWHGIDLRPHGEGTVDLSLAIPAAWAGRADIKVTASPMSGRPQRWA